VERDAISMVERDVLALMEREVLAPLVEREAFSRAKVQP
jgi:hypothetical protein